MIEEMGSENNKKRKYLRLDKVIYDVTDFKHPGGSVIHFLTAEDPTQCVDASAAFQEFHSRSSNTRDASKKPSTYLSKFAKVENVTFAKFSAEEEKRRDELTKDFAKFRKELEAEGYFDADPVHLLYRIVELVVLFGVSFYMFSLPGLWPLGILLNGVAQGRCGWFMHECGHHSATTIPWLDVRLQELFYGVGCGMSGAWWRVAHNKHHCAPQKLDHDVDLDTLPLVAFNVKSARGKDLSNSFLGKWLSYQKYLFPPVSCFLVGLFWSLYLHPRHIVRTKRFMEAVWLIMRYVAWYSLTVSLCKFPPSQAFALYLGSFGLGCVYIFVNFAVSHTHRDVSDPEDDHHWVEYASDFTTDVATSSFAVTWFMSYLNFQVMHHMFPSMPQKNFPIIADRVVKFLKDHNLQYDHRGYFQALHDTLENLDHVGHELNEKPVVKDL